MLRDLDDAEGTLMALQNSVDFRWTRIRGKENILNRSEPKILSDALSVLEREVSYWRCFLEDGYICKAAEKNDGLKDA